MDADFAIIGGTGLYSILDSAEEVSPDTKYGKPSSPISIGEIGGKKVAFLPRHGKNHSIPPHKVPYAANIEALASLGVKRILASNTVGSLRPDYRPGEIVIFDQYVNLTSGRVDTYDNGPEIRHLSSPDPYCRNMRKILVDESDNLDFEYHVTGTVVVINGPRFSTRAESRVFTRQGFDVISMTPYPEVTLAREKGMCYAAVGLITDYDNGLEGREDIEPVTFAKIKEMFERNAESVKSLIKTVVPRLSANQESCDCAKGY